MNAAWDAQAVRQFMPAVVCWLAAVAAWLLREQVVQQPVWLELSSLLVWVVAVLLLACVAGTLRVCWRLHVARSASTPQAPDAEMMLARR